MCCTACTSIPAVAVLSILHCKLSSKTRFLNQLRLREGVYINDFSARTGLSWQVVEQRVQQAVERGLLETHQERVRPTELGWKFVNDIQQMFLP